MVRFNWLTKGLLLCTASLSLAAGQTTTSTVAPLRVCGSSSAKGNITTYRVKFQNRTDRVIEGVWIRKVGIGIHYREFRPEYKVGPISPGKEINLTFDVRGTVSPPPESETIGIEGYSRSGHQTTNYFLPFPDNCRRNG